MERFPTPCQKEARLYPFDREVVVRDGQGQVHTFKLLDIITDRYLVLIDKEHEPTLTDFVGEDHILEAEVELLAEEAFVIDGKEGLILRDREAAPLVAHRSNPYALRLAAVRWMSDLPELDVGAMDERDLALAFELEAAKRRRDGLA